MRVGVKLCGNCNPTVAGDARLRSLADVDRQIDFVRWDDDDYRVLMIVSGCGRDCASRPSFSGPVVEVTDNTVDQHYVAEAGMPQAIVGALRARGEG